MSMFSVAVCSDSMTGARRRKGKVRANFDELFFLVHASLRPSGQARWSMRGVKDEANAEKNLERCDELFLLCMRFSNYFVKADGSMRGEKHGADAEKNL